ncbi:sulfate transporter family protein [Propylenella binzhouense]|uniref:Sulfate transporter family protein n=1 Tax=Propylenella binzhouense TaxID=2555902 RepID=A0A964T3A9_9HYPH|nr:sulfate transporter family protein [Propylenella binzhouense]MYZ47514.1 sulfate transporter family protein [Propylenella binzhouense]
MIGAAMLAFEQIFSAPFRSVMWKALALTVALLAVLWIALQHVVLYLVVLPFPWLETAFSIVSGVGIVVGLAFFIAPVTSLFAGLFLDDVAEVVERTHYPADPPGRAMPLGRSVLTTLQFTGVVVLVNLVALPLVFLLGFGVIVFFVANGYLLGREYFELAALRFHSHETTRALRLRNSGRVFLSGLAIAAFLSVPLLNLFTPLFATAFMVHVQKRISARESGAGGVLAPA